MSKDGLTLKICEKQMKAALAQLRHGDTPETREKAVQEVDTAIADAARIPSATWHDAQAKADMARVCLMGRNAKAARRIIASLARDLENLPAKGSLPC